MDIEKADTGIEYMLQAYKMGGPYMHLITFLGILVFVITIWKIFAMVKNTQVDLKWLTLIRMAGSVALAVGFMSQIIGIIQSLEAIREAADVSPQIVLGGAIVSFYAPIYGFIVFIFSMLFYFVLKEVIRNKMGKV